MISRTISCTFSRPTVRFLLAFLFAVTFFQPQARCGSLDDLTSGSGDIQGLSNDGTVVCEFGYVNVGDSSYTQPAYKGHTLELYGISADGNTMVGRYYDNGSYHTCIITDSGATDIGSAGDSPFGISADGKHVVGLSGPNAWYWSTTTGYKTISFNGYRSYAMDVSNTGVVAGYADDSKAYAWSPHARKLQ